MISEYPTLRSSWGIGGGGSHDRTDLLPLKAGVAVIALEAHSPFGSWGSWWKTWKTGSFKTDGWDGWTEMRWNLKGLTRGFDAKSPCTLYLIKDQNDWCIFRTHHQAFHSAFRILACNVIVISVVFCLIILLGTLRTFLFPEYWGLPMVVKIKLWYTMMHVLPPWYVHDVGYHYIIIFIIAMACFNDRCWWPRRERGQTWVCIFFTFHCLWLYNMYQHVLLSRLKLSGNDPNFGPLRFLLSQDQGMRLSL